MTEGRIFSNKGFYIGDICYVLGEKLYHDFWGTQNKYSSGVYRNVLGTGLGFAVSHTKYGDGIYNDQRGHQYYVDAGVIGAVPLELIEQYGRTDDSQDLGRTITFDDGERHKLDFHAEDGFFDILCDYRHYYIDTKW